MSEFEIGLIELRSERALRKTGSVLKFIKVKIGVKAELEG